MKDVFYSTRWPKKRYLFNFSDLEAADISNLGIKLLDKFFALAVSHWNYDADLRHQSENWLNWVK